MFNTTEGIAIKIPNGDYLIEKSIKATSSEILVPLPFIFTGTSMGGRLIF